LLDETDYALLAEAEKDVRSETPFLLISVVVFAMTVALVIVSPEMWVRILGYLLGLVVGVNAASTLSSVTASIRLIREFEAQLKQHRRLFVEESFIQSKEERNA